MNICGDCNNTQSDTLLDTPCLYWVRPLFALKTALILYAANLFAAYYANPPNPPHPRGALLD